MTGQLAYASSIATLAMSEQLTLYIRAHIVANDTYRAHDVHD
jgi:hypothetical protein